MHVHPIHPTFKAEQNVNIKLQRQESSTLAHRASRIVWNILSVVIFPIGMARIVGWAINFSAKLMVLPSRWAYSKQTLKMYQKAFDSFCFGPTTEINRSFKNKFVPERHFVETFDGAKLHTVHFHHRESTPETPTVLLVPSNGAFVEQGVYSWLVEKSIARDSICNFIVFDYRGVSRSTGELNETRDLVTDADAIYQFATQTLEVQPGHLDLYGWSMGGCVGAKLKVLHPEIGKFVSERSYSSLLEILFSWIPKPARPLFYWIYTTLKNWDLSVPYNKLNELPLIVYHEDDLVVPLESSSYQGALKTQRAFASIKLELREDIEEEEEDEIDHHTEPLESYNVALTNNRADNEIAAYILPTPAIREQERAE